MYVSSQTQSFTMTGSVLSARRVKLKGSDSLEGNSVGIGSGAILGGIAGSGLGGGRGSVLGAAGGALAGGILGAAVQDKLSESEGIEYVVKLDKGSIKDDVYYDGPASMRTAVSSARASGLITVVQGADEALRAGDSVYVIISANRTRVIRR